MIFVLLCFVVLAICFPDIFTALVGWALGAGLIIAAVGAVALFVLTVAV
jgi:hypothetical protein